MKNTHSMSKLSLNIKQLIKVDNIVFAGSLGEYFSYFKEYMNVSKNVNCFFISTHRNKTLIGVSHLIFKDKFPRLENK